MSRRFRSLLTAALLASCAPSTGTDRQASPPVIDLGESPPVIDLGEIEDAPMAAPTPATAEPPPTTMPTGVYPSLSALCEARATLIEPTLRQAQSDLAERGMTDLLVPHCELSKTALDGVTITLAAPFLELAALEVETGYATETHLAVRTADGWLSVPHASMVSFHDDPGCFTIERDAGLVSVKVVGDDAPSLALVEKSARGATMDYREESGIVTVQTFDDVSERSVACGFDGHTFACEQPKLLSVTRVLSAP